MKVTAFFALVAMLLVSCGGGGSSEVDGTPDEWAQRALEAMAGAESYRVEFSLPDSGSDASWTYEYAAPDSFRFTMEVAEKSGSGECYVLPDGQESGDCREEETITDRYTFEAVYVGDAAYTRECEDAGGDCGEWEQHERPPYVIVGPSPSYLPDWPLVAMEMATWSDVRGDGDGAVVGGSVNHMRAIFENQRRVLTAGGITSFGTECSSAAFPTDVPPEAIQVGENLAGDAPEGVSCRELTFEEMLEDQEPDLSFFDTTPASIEVTVSRDDGYVRRIELRAEAPDHEDGFEMVIEYSDIGSVTIEAPE